MAFGRCWNDIFKAGAQQSPIKTFSQLLKNNPFSGPFYLFSFLFTRPRSFLSPVGGIHRRGPYLQKHILRIGFRLSVHYLIKIYSMCLFWWRTHVVAAPQQNMSKQTGEGWRGWQGVNPDTKLWLGPSVWEKTKKQKWHNKRPVDCIHLFFFFFAFQNDTCCSSLCFSIK